MLKKTIWTLLLLASIISTGILLTGFISAILITSSSPKEIVAVTPSKPKIIELDPNFYNILVLGDSLAKGTGDEKGIGFAGYYANSIKSKTSKEIKINNLAVNGGVSNGLLKIVEDSQTLADIKNSNIIFISIGGNEITQFKNTDIALATNKIKTIQDNYLNNLKETYKLIRTNNSSCMVIFIGLYNPFGKEITADKVTFLNSWNYGSQQLISTDSNSLFIPTYDLFKYNLESYLTLDNFHPNSAGYTAISNRVIEALKTYK